MNSIQSTSGKYAAINNQTMAPKKSNEVEIFLDDLIADDKLAIASDDLYKHEHETNCEETRYNCFTLDNFIRIMMTDDWISEFYIEGNIFDLANVKNIYEGKSLLEIDTVILSHLKTINSLVLKAEKIIKEKPGKSQDIGGHNDESCTTLNAESRDDVAADRIVRDINIRKQLDALLQSSTELDETRSLGLLKPFELPPKFRARYVNGFLLRIYSLRSALSLSKDDIVFMSYIKTIIYSILYNYGDEDMVDAGDGHFNMKYKYGDTGYLSDLNNDAEKYLNKKDKDGEYCLSKAILHFRSRIEEVINLFRNKIKEGNWSDAFMNQLIRYNLTTPLQA
jgi:hypothetical protein